VKRFGYSGGIGEGGIAQCSPQEASQEQDASSNWRCHVNGQHLFLRASGERARLFPIDSLAVIIRGYVARTDGSIKDPASLAQEQVNAYLRAGIVDIDHLDGSFTIVLADGTNGRIILYRNLVGAGHTYYQLDTRGFRFSSNLADLMTADNERVFINQPMLPVYFLYRSVPGRETLAKGIYRLMPGEMVTFGQGNLKRSQRQNFHHFQNRFNSQIEPVEVVEATLSRILSGYAAQDARTINLLSGGVDSSLLQALWNQVTDTHPCQPQSVEVAVDHPMTRADREYALSAAKALRTNHISWPACNPYIEYLVDAIASTGETPNHVQTAYFGPLARHLARAGFCHGICGEGADGLFGIESASRLQMATLIRAALPFPRLQQLGAKWAAQLGRTELAASFGLASHVKDWTNWQHPINQVAAFTDRDSIEACFGRAMVDNATAYRRSLLDQYDVPDRPLDRLHAAGYLGEATESASLWTELFNGAGVELWCPFLDSRLLRVALNLPASARFPFRRPKRILRQALARHVPHEIAYRTKRGFGQPIIEWLMPQGQLRPWVESLGDYDFIPRAVTDQAISRPNWFLYSLLCMDLWHKIFVDKRPIQLQPTGASAPAN
jgi:asparagine synthase (glutamine-hydrolysing)